MLGLGSNRPYNGLSREDVLALAAAELGRILEGCALSPLYETAPLYVTAQGPFLNAAASGLFRSQGGGEGRAAAARAARSLLLAVQAVEARFGRDRASERRWGERTLDIDILLFGGECIAEPGLVIPHPRLK